MMEISKIKNFETELAETQAESIVFEGEQRTKVLFMDNKERFVFRSALGSLNSKNRYHSKSNSFESKKIFVTTFNVGYAEPPDLTIWLEKAFECEVVVIGMQETKASTWLEKIQLYLEPGDFQLISLNTMWKVPIYSLFDSNDV